MVPDEDATMRVLIVDDDVVITKVGGGFFVFSLGSLRLVAGSAYVV